MSPVSVYVIIATYRESKVIGVVNSLDFLLPSKDNSIIQL